MHRRDFLSTGLTGTTVLITGCTGAGDDTDDTDDGVLNGDDGGGGSNGVIFEEGQSQTFEGTGTEETERFELNRGLMRYRYESDVEEGIFTSSLVDLERSDSGEFLDDRSLTNYSTPISGEQMNIVSGGEYLIDVEVEGEWSLEIDQPVMEESEVEELPFEATGDSPQYLGPVELHEDAEVNASHEGEGVFQVDSITTDGHWDVPVNESGAVDATRSFRDEGTAWINVVGDGDWSVEIE